MLPKTKEVLDFLSNDNLFADHDIRFVGGTALSYLLNHRLSEDLDFAMASLLTDEIENSMKKSGAIKVEHSQIAKDYALNDGSELDNYHLKYLLDGVKIEFFSPRFNVLEKELWQSEPTTSYQSSHLQIASLKTIFYMKTQAFWNRKKYRDIYDIYYLLTHTEHKIDSFVNLYIKYNITYTKEDLLALIRSRNEFYERVDDEGINLLVDDPKPYEWYRKQIEAMLEEMVLREIYN